MIVTALANERPRRERAPSRSLLDGEPVQISAQSPRGNATAGVPYSVAANFFTATLALPILPVNLALNSHLAGHVLSSRVIR
jgi:hypothetical protein